MTSRMDTTPMDTTRIRLKSLNAYIVCYICKGYLIEATTVIDCLHTFCKSCLLKHFVNENTCPKCESLIHQSHPSHYVSPDRTMQDIVYKLVPNLLSGETERRERFNREHGISDTETEEQEETEKPCPSVQQGDPDFHRKDEQVNVSLQCASEGGGGSAHVLARPYIRCSAQITIVHLKKYIARFAFDDPDRFTDIDILCNDELMGKDHSLKFIQRTRWRLRTMPLELHYRRHIDF